MKIDLTLPVTPAMWQDAKTSQKPELEGHLGTHFDVMNREFPLDYTERRAVVFDVSAAAHREILPEDIDLSRVEAGMFVILRSGYGETEPYGTRAYFKEHPQLSFALIDALLEKRVALIGVDFAGVRRGAEHTPTDQRCADRGVFIIENLHGLQQVIDRGGEALVHTYPLVIQGVTGLPCRVIAEM